LLVIHRKGVPPRSTFLGRAAQDLFQSASFAGIS
jgi:hypothetical protein